MAMPFTGERYVPEVRGQIYYEHLHRYSLALRLARGADVLDIASGEGYGAAYLSMVANSVIGVDIDPQSVRHAASRYTEMNLSFRVGSCTHIPLADASVDLVVSFETIEHLAEQDQFLREILRVLRPDGRLLISSPNKLVYSDLPKYENPYHVRELYFDEFRDLLQASFAHCRLYGQRVIGASAIHPLRGVARDAQCIGPSSSEDSWGLPALPEPTYFIAVCARSGSMDDLEQLDSIFIDPRDDLVRHLGDGSSLAPAGELLGARYLEPPPSHHAFPPAADDDGTARAAEVAAAAREAEIAAAFETERVRWDEERAAERELVRGLLRPLLGDDAATVLPLHEAIGRGHSALADLFALRARLAERTTELEAALAAQRAAAEESTLRAGELARAVEELERRAEAAQSRLERALDDHRAAEEAWHEERTTIVRRLELDTDELGRLEQRAAMLLEQAEAAESRAAKAARQIEELTIALHHATQRAGSPEAFVAQRGDGRELGRAELAAMTAQLDAIVNSRSWRVTKPLRLAARALRRK